MSGLTIDDLYEGCQLVSNIKKIDASSIIITADLVWNNPRNNNRESVTNFIIPLSKWKLCMPIIDLDENDGDCI